MSECSPILDSLRQQFLGKIPPRSLEPIARENGISLRDCTRCLSEDLWTEIAGDHFIPVMQDLVHWGPVTTIIHTDDVILEITDPIPDGSVGQGFYNLHSKRGLHGHLRADNCESIIFLERPFMGSHTASITFFNAAGAAMFKVFVGRDEEGQLLEDQLTRFRSLPGKLSGQEAV